MKKSSIILLILTNIQMMLAGPEIRPTLPCQKSDYTRFRIYQISSSCGEDEISTPLNFSSDENLLNSLTNHCLEIDNTISKKYKNNCLRKIMFLFLHPIKSFKKIMKFIDIKNNPTLGIKTPRDLPEFLKKIKDPFPDYSTDQFYDIVCKELIRNPKFLNK